MTDKEKIAQIIAEHLCSQGKAHKTLYGAERMCYSRDNFAECEKVSECVDALIAAGVGDVKENKFEADHYWSMWQGSLVESERAEHRAEVAEKALDTVYKEACEKYEKEIKQLMRKVFGDYIANGIGGYIDNIKERLLEEGYEH